MSMVKLQNHTSRNAFDLSRRNAFTAKVGELLPVACIECIPGDKVKGRVQHFTRTMPVNTAAYTRIREYYDWYFVPTNLLWNKFNNFITQMQEQSNHAQSIISSQRVGTTHPYFTFSQVAQYINTMTSAAKKNQFGFSRSSLSVKLLNYLGYGDFSTAQGTASGFFKENANLNPFPLLAYQKIYQDYYRHSQWEQASSSSFNVDYIASIQSSSNNLPISSLSTGTYADVYNMFDLRYSNWNKDLFMGLSPNAQYGVSASIFVPTSTDVQHISLVSGNPNQTGSALTLVNPSGGYNIQLSNGAAVRGELTIDQIKQLQIKLGVNNISILALRQAEALQKWKEITQSQQQDYKSQIEAHFGVSMSDAYSERCRYIDGSVSNLDISEVTNTNITSSNAANIAGKGVGVGDGSFSFSSDVHGYLMCIYHATPLLDYAISGINRTNLKTQVTDYAIPEFDRTGMVSVPLIELTNSSAASEFTTSGLLGYAPRYYEYKQAIDEVHGAFRNTLGSWVAPVSDGYITNYISQLGFNGLTYQFFKVNPATMNPIFAKAADSSLDSDQLLVNASFDITAVRNLDRNGLPY